MQTSEAPASPKVNSEWSSLHPAMIPLGVLSIVRANLFPLLLGGFAATRLSTFYVALFFGSMFLLPIFMVFMRFLSFRYYLGMGHITIREGIFSKKIRSIPVKRIHNLNSSQSLPARWLKIVRLDVETAGGAASEASFVALSFTAAEEIREYVRREKRESSNETERQDASEPEAEPIYKIGLKDIFIAGATTNKMGLILVAVFALLQYFQESTYERFPGWAADLFRWLEAWNNQNIFILALLGIAAFTLLFLVSWVISIITALVQWYGFTLVRREQDLHITTGLFTLREYTIPSEKIQALEAVSSPIRRPFGLLQIKVCSAGHVGLQENRRSPSDLLVPLTSVNRVPNFLESVWPDADWRKLNWTGVHPYTRARHFRILFFIQLILLGAAGFFLGFNPLVKALTALVVLLGSPMAWVVSHLTYKQMAFAYDQKFLYIKNGFIGLHFWVIPVGKIQNLNLYQDPFQRRRSLVSLAVDVAGAGSRAEPVIHNIGLQEAWRLFHRLLPHQKPYLDSGAGLPAATPEIQNQPL